MIYSNPQVCGHKWKFRGGQNGPQRLPQGQCLISGRSLTDFKLVRPCTPLGMYVYYYVLWMWFLV